MLSLSLRVYAEREIRFIESATDEMAHGDAHLLSIHRFCQLPECDPYAMRIPRTHMIEIFACALNNDRSGFMHLFSPLL